MKKEEIYLWDVQRILFGEAPPAFLLEVALRTLIMFLAGVIVVRLMGKRLNGQLTIIELSIIVTIGAILSVPMQIPDRGLLQGLLVLFCMLFFLRATNQLSISSPRFEQLVQGKTVTLVEDGIVNLRNLTRLKISKPLLFTTLRGKNVFQLSKVKRLYLEACGTFSLYEEKNAGPGLPLYPPEDEGVLHTARPAENAEACCNCGWVRETAGKNKCPHCGANDWTQAIF